MLPSKPPSSFLLDHLNAILAFLGVTLSGLAVKCISLYFDLKKLRSDQDESFLTRLQTQVVALSEENRNLRAELEANRQNNHIEQGKLWDELRQARETHHAEIKALEERIDRMETEHDRVKGELTEMELLAATTRTRNLELETENRRLRGILKQAGIDPNDYAEALGS